MIAECVYPAIFTAAVSKCMIIISNEIIMQLPIQLEVCASSFCPASHDSLASAKSSTWQQSSIVVDACAADDGGHSKANCKSKAVWVRHANQITSLLQKMEALCFSKENDVYHANSTADSMQLLIRYDTCVQRDQVRYDVLPYFVSSKLPLFVCCR